MDDADSFSLDINSDGVPGGVLDPPIMEVWLSGSFHGQSWKVPRMFRLRFEIESFGHC